MATQQNHQEALKILTAGPHTTARGSEAEPQALVLGKEAQTPQGRRIFSLPRAVSGLF